MKIYLKTKDTEMNINDCNQSNLELADKINQLFPFEIIIPKTGNSYEIYSAYMNKENG